MVADPLVLDQTKMIEGGTEQTNQFGGELNFKGGPMNPNDAMVMLKDIILCLLGFRFIYIAYIS